MSKILAPEDGRKPAALITWFCTQNETHVFRFMADGSLKHTRAPIPGEQVDDVVKQTWNDQHGRLFNIVQPRSEKDYWQLLDELGRLIAPLVLDLEPGTPLVVEPHKAIARLPLALLRLDEEFLIERHPLAIVSCHAHLMTARRRNVARRLNQEAGETDRILAVGVGRSEAERQRCDFDPLKDWSDVEAAPPGLRVERLLWERATLPILKQRLPGHRFCAFTCHGHYQYLAVEDSGLILASGQKLDLQALANMELDLDLVFCNTCVSGQSRSLYADEPFGVPMSFALAGAPCVIGSLWDVWYDAGRNILRSFFQLRRKGSRQTGAAVALQQAMLANRKVFPDPFHWGGWLLYGDWI
jgi:CHAT domain-containing protein